MGTATSTRRRPAADAASVLERVGGGALRQRPFSVRFWDGSELPATESGPEGEFALVLRDPRAVRYILWAPGQLGLARAWVSGALDVEGDLDRVLELRHRFERVRLGTTDRLRALAGALRVGGARLLTPLAPPAAEPRLRGRLHSPERDREAVRHHYDVSNAFYRMVLGPTLVYSCAYFDSPEDTLEAAQERKLDRICAKLRLQPGERLLDVGCGWGSLVIHAARHYGVRAVGVTLSEPQAELARERVREAGLSDQIEVRVADYREVSDGPYDKIASVGMSEHVGAAELEGYAGSLRALLRPGGLFLNHAIAQLNGSVPDRRRSFIYRYVFPDGELEPVGDVITAFENRGLEIRDVEAMREHYALTLRRWVANLAANRDAAIAEAGEDRERIWRLYMTASARGFEEGVISVFQVLAANPGAAHPLPLARRNVFARAQTE